ncbi:unnamed protein product [Rhizopus stolonifer]
MYHSFLTFLSHFMDNNTTNSQQDECHNCHNTAVRCYNCEATSTPLWRRDDDGNTICNACGLYYKLHHVHRPLSLRRNVIHRRKRVQMIQHRKIPKEQMHVFHSQQSKHEASRKKSRTDDNGSCRLSPIHETNDIPSSLPNFRTLFDTLSLPEQPNTSASLTNMLFFEPDKFYQILTDRRDELQTEINSINQLLTQSTALLDVVQNNETLATIVEAQRPNNQSGLFDSLLDAIEIDVGRRNKPRDFSL